MDAFLDAECVPANIQALCLNVTLPSDCRHQTGRVDLGEPARLGAQVNIHQGELHTLHSNGHIKRNA